MHAKRASGRLGEVDASPRSHGGRWNEDEEGVDDVDDDKKEEEDESCVERECAAML